jgi:hypothetical protein
VRDDELDRLVEQDRQRPGDPFADTGPAIERILAAGAARGDHCLVLRCAAYGAVFNTLYEIDPEGAGVDCKDLIGLYELLLSADPSGMEGRSEPPAMQNGPVCCTRGGLIGPETPMQRIQYHR